MTSETPIFLVFGAYGGIGSALARQLADTGARLSLAGRDTSRLAALASELPASAGTRQHVADATDFEAVDAAVKGTLDHFGRLDGVVNCVGSVLLKPAHMTKPEEWVDTLHTNLTSAFAILRSAARPMMRQKSGAIALVSTAAAHLGLPNHEAIAAAKGGIDALVRSAAATYGKAGIRVNAVAPGLVETPMTERITRSDAARASSEAMHALGRIGTADEVAAAIRFLLSAEATWITGQTLGVDGGLGAARSA